MFLLGIKESDTIYRIVHYSDVHHPNIVGDAQEIDIGTTPIPAVPAIANPDSQTAQLLINTTDNSLYYELRDKVGTVELSRKLLEKMIDVDAFRAQGDANISSQVFNIVTELMGTLN